MWCSLRNTMGSEDRWVEQHLGNRVGILRHYIDVKNFECEGFSDTCMENYNGGSSSGGQFISITGNNIHDVGRYCATTTTGRDGIFISNDNVTIEGNRSTTSGGTRPGRMAA